MIQEDVPSLVWSLVIYYLCWTLIVRAELLQKSTHTQPDQVESVCSGDTLCRLKWEWDWKLNNDSLDPLPGTMCDKSQSATFPQVFS